MRKLLLLSLFLATSLCAKAQDFPRLQKFSIGESGFQAYLPSYPENLELTWSEDSSMVWAGDVEAGGLLFGLVCVQLAEPLEDDDDLQLGLLESYLDYLQEAFNVIESAGYGRGHTLESSPGAKGVLDYWVDSDGYTWKIKGWINTRYIAVLYIGGGEEEPNINGANMFLDGIRFPE
ncbi:MAG: hypothetical protein H6563_15340 [Lewinellaceae bacterium]|nr:hypothetical protein [Lewinellaceae bacterium]